MVEQRATNAQVVFSFINEIEPAFLEKVGFLSHLEFRCLCRAVIRLSCEWSNQSKGDVQHNVPAAYAF